MSGSLRRRWPTARVGRRGALLLIVGVGEFVWGLQFMLDPAPRPQGLTLLTDAAPLHVWAWVWVVAGAAAAGSAFVKLGRDWAGFAAALAPPIVWLAAYLTAAASGEYARGLWIAGYYATIHVGVLLWASATPEYAAARGAAPGEEGGDG